VYFPQVGVTKGEVLAHYHAVSPYLLPHLRDRPLTLERYPEGIEGESFYQKDTFLSRTTDLEHPDVLVIDIDPPELPSPRSIPLAFSRAREAAHILRGELQRVGLDPLVKTSGKRGLHLGLPLDGTLSFAQVRDVLAGLFETAVTARPDLLTREARIEKRGDRVYLDALRMALGATVVAPYVVRATSVASVSMPLTWEELDIIDDPFVFTVRTAGERLGRTGDLWTALTPR
jgi:bifunctional non-homologous end joining protein LigD